MDKVFNLQLDIKNSSIGERIEVVRGDIGNVLNIRILDNYIPVSLVGITLKAIISKADNTTVFQDSTSGLIIIDAKNGLVELKLKANSVSCSGNVEIEIVLLEGEDRITSAKFNYYVRESLDTGNVPISEDEKMALDDYVKTLKNGLNGKNLEFVWSGTQLGVRQEGEIDYKFVNLQGNEGSKGDTGIQGLQGSNGISITNVIIDAMGHLQITLSNNTTIDAGTIAIDAVSSVNGKTGDTVVLNASDIKAEGGQSIEAYLVEMVSHATDAIKHITAAERTAWSAKQSALGFTPLNKAGDTATGILKAQSNTSYTVAQLHNTILSTTDAVLGSMQNGDIWIKYV